MPGAEILPRTDFKLSHLDCVLGFKGVKLTSAASDCWRRMQTLQPLRAAAADNIFFSICQVLAPWQIAYFDTLLPLSRGG